MDSEAGKRIYSHRMSVVEPVFANITANKRLKRFSLRRRPKVQSQWRQFCLVHNIEKILDYSLVMQPDCRCRISTIKSKGESMYDLPYHNERDLGVIRSFINEHPFAFLTGCDPNGKPIATQVPVFLEEEDGHRVLRGHMMRNTDHHKAFLDNENVLVVFSGSQAYASGSWYSNPHTPSTWNYMSVHARGTIRFLEGSALEDMLRKTSLHFEACDRESPTIYDNLPAELTQRLMKMIVAFEITVAEMDNVFRLSQDREAISYRSIIKQLKTKGENGRNIAA